MVFSRDFEPPTPYYDEQLKPIDEQIAALIAQREQLSDGHPGFPYPKYLDEWATTFQVPLTPLQRAFFALHQWHESPPRRVDPEGFVSLVPIMRSETRGDLHVVIPYMRQYTNCTVVYVELEGPMIRGRSHFTIDLTIAGYDCRPHSGQSDTSYFGYKFVVTPIIPADSILSQSMTVSFESRPFPRQRNEEPVTIPYTTVIFPAGD